MNAIVELQHIKRSSDIVQVKLQYGWVVLQSKHLSGKVLTGVQFYGFSIA